MMIYTVSVLSWATLGKFPSVRPESVMTPTMDGDGNDDDGDSDSDHEDDDETDLISKFHAICIRYLHNQNRQKSAMMQSSDDEWRWGFSWNSL